MNTAAFKQFSRSARGGGQSGFTLVEILVVIGIIVVLAAVLLGISRSMIQSSRATQSISHVKQIGAAIAAYAADNNSQIPPHFDADNPVIPGNSGASYARFLANYAQISGHNSRPGLNFDGRPSEFINGKRPPGIFASPNSKAVVTLASYETDYGYNHWASYSRNYRHMNRVPDPSRLLLAADTTGANINFGSEDGGLVNRYKNKATVLYFDLHVDMKDCRDREAFQRKRANDYPWSVPDNY